MSEVFQDNVSSRYPIEWFLKHLGTINAVMYEAWLPNYNALIAEGTDENILYLLKPYDPLLHRRTEMPLCDTWREIEKKIGLPENFKINYAGIFIGSDQLRYDHTYIQQITPDGQRVVLCDTLAQFMPSSKDTLRGDQAKELQRRAHLVGRDDLLKIIGNMTVIYGEVNDIFNALGIFFAE